MNRPRLFRFVLDLAHLALVCLVLLVVVPLASLAAGFGAVYRAWKRPTRRPSGPSPYGREPFYWVKVFALFVFVLMASLILALFFYVEAAQ